MYQTSPMLDSATVMFDTFPQFFHHKPSFTYLVPKTETKSANHGFVVLEVKLLESSLKKLMFNFTGLI